MKAEIKNLKKAAARILQAVGKKEKVIIFGDSDPDGVGAVIILEETLRDLGLKPAEIYFPDRQKEGYGLNEKALAFLKKQSPALIILVDCGIGNVEEIDMANKMGFEVIILDHHKVLSRVPKASIICDPKQEGDKYPFKEFAAAGVVYKLSKLLFSMAAQKYQPEKFLEITALSTIADMMAMEADNVRFVRDGLLALNFSKRPGLIALMDITDFKNWDIEEVRHKLIPVLCAGETKNHLNETYSLLVEKKPAKAKKMAQFLLAKSGKRKEEISRIFLEIEERMDERELIVFDGDPGWPLPLLGPSASRICNRYNKPVFLFHQGKEESPGAVRMPKGMDAVKAMASCEDLLKTYGGHPPAAGFRLKNENLDKFKQCLIEYFKK